MTVRGAIMSVLGTLVSLVTYFSGREELWPIAAALNAVWFLCLLSALLGSLTLRSDQRTGEECVWHKKEALLHFTAHGLCVFPVQLRWTCRTEDKVASSCEQVCGFGRKHRESTLSLSCPHVGELAYTCRAEVRDVCGLFRVPLRGCEAPQVVVLPVNHLSRRHFEAGKVVTEDMTHFHSSDWGDTLTDARLYREGDSLKQIHWKLSMRRQEWYTRQYEEEERRRMILWIDPMLPAENAADYRDEVCTAVGTIAFRLTLDGVDVTFGTDPEHVITAYTGQGIAQFYRAIALFDWGGDAAPIQVDAPVLVFGGCRVGFADFIYKVFGTRGEGVSVSKEAPSGDEPCIVWQWPQDLMLLR